MGLTQIFQSKSEDLFLTGNAQISFFKIVYRRYTHFAVKSVSLDFMGNPDFGSELAVVLDKAGDLLHRAYLEVQIPPIQFLKNKDEWEFTYAEKDEKIKLLESFYNHLRNYFRNLLRQDLLARDLSVQRKNLEIQWINIQHFFPINFFPIIREIHRKNILSFYPRIQKTLLDIHTLLTEEKKQVQNYVQKKYREFYRTAWVGELGHALIEKIDFKIGNEIIDSHTGDWYRIAHHLYDSENHKESYDRMIGNVPILTDFHQEKEGMTLMIPLRFWFCRHSGMALPIISLKKHELTINLKLKNLDELLLVENVEYYPPIHLQGIKLYADYILLDITERKKFAQSSHEYLIEQVQFQTEILEPAIGQIVHLHFTNPTKYFVWFVRLLGQDKNLPFNLGEGANIENVHISLNHYPVSEKSHDMKYYNFEQPGRFFHKSPPLGLYLHSFSIYPKEYQPSSSCNFSRIDDFSLHLQFQLDFLKKAQLSKTSIYFGAYAVCYNILRIMSGLGHLAFKNY